MPLAHIGVSVRLVGTDIGSTTLFEYQNVGISNAKWLCCPTRGPKQMGLCSGGIRLLSIQWLN